MWTLRGRVVDVGMGRGDLTDAEWERLRPFLGHLRGLGRSRGGFTSNLHLSTDGGCRPLSLAVTPGQRAGGTQFVAVLEKIRVPRPRPGRPRMKPDSLAADNAFSNGPVREYLRRRGIHHTMPEKSDSQAARIPDHLAPDLTTGRSPAAAAHTEDLGEAMSRVQPQ
ncbi:transposase [Streptomyces sp. NPDC056943]|uniref:transposase n=1 Tax=Streptomyces sp. NPDC056943 TaxID=3345971 RepID=UPI0036330447